MSIMLVTQTLLSVSFLLSCFIEESISGCFKVEYNLLERNLCFLFRKWVNIDPTEKTESQKTYLYFNPCYLSTYLLDYSKQIISFIYHRFLKV